MNTDLIPLPEHKEYVYKVEGDTQDIIDIVLNAAKTKVNKQFCDFSNQISKDESGLRKLWSFVKYKIVYQKDDDGRQDVLLPAALWFRGWGDCKSKTVFIAHVLQCLKIPYIIRFTTYNKGSNYTHVYPVALLNGKSVILDTVYDFFDREKTYTKKLDYPMTKISMISGLSEPDYEKLAKEKVIEIEQKRSLISKQEPVELKDKKVGDVRALLLRRQLQLLATFNSDNREKVREYNKALVTLDKAIVKGVRGYKAIGGIDTVEIAVNNLINTRLKDNRPALSFNNTFAGKNYKKIGALPQQYQRLYIEGANDIDIRKSILGKKSDGTWVYKMGANTPYEVNYDKVIEILNKYVSTKRMQSYNPQRFETRFGRQVERKEKHFDIIDNFYNVKFNNARRQINFGTYLGGITSATQGGDWNGLQALSMGEAVGFSTIANSLWNRSGINTEQKVYDALDRVFNGSPYFSKGLYPIIYENANREIQRNLKSEYLWMPISAAYKGQPSIAQTYPTDLFNSNETTEGNNPPRAFLKFTSYDNKLAFEKYVEEQSGIWDKYLNERVFKEDKGMGCGLLYNWCDRVPNSSMNMYSNLVTSKSIIQQQYMSGMNYLTGADSTIIDDMGRNTAIFGLGKNPEDVLDDLLYATGKKPAVGEVVTIITAIIGGVISLLGTILPIVLTNQNDAKRDADNLDPTKSMGVTPIGEGLMPDVAKDFEPDSGSGSGSNNNTNNNTNNNGSGSGAGLDTNTLLGLGIAAAGTYFLLNKKSKK